MPSRFTIPTLDTSMATQSTATSPTSPSLVAAVFRAQRTSRFRRAPSFARPLGSPIRLDVLASPPLTPAEEHPDPLQQHEHAPLMAPAPVACSVGVIAPASAQLPPTALASPIQLTSESSATTTEEWSAIQQRMRLPVPRTRRHHCAHPDCPIWKSDHPQLSARPTTADTLVENNTTEVSPSTTPCKHHLSVPHTGNSPFAMGAMSEALEKQQQLARSRRMKPCVRRTSKRKATSPLPNRPRPLVFSNGVPISPTVPGSPRPYRRQPLLALFAPASPSSRPCTPPPRRAATLDDDVEGDRKHDDKDTTSSYSVKRRHLELERLPSPPKTPVRRSTAAARPDDEF